MNYPDQDYPDKAPALAGLYEATRNLSTAEAAQIIRISKGYGIPTVDAAAALPTFGSYANDDVDWDGVRVRAPLTTEFLLNDPYYAKALQSSIRDMEAAEGTVKTWKALQNGFKGVGRGLLRFGQMVQETVQNADNTLAPINEADVWANPAKESVKAFENQNRTFVPATTLRNMAESSWLKPKQNTPDGLAEELWLGFMETVPQVAAQLLVAGATGGTSGLVAGTLFMGSQIAGSQYEKLTEQKVEPFRAFQASIADAVMQAPLEMLSLGKTFKRIPVGKAAREYLEKATTEAITEWAQQYPEAATEIWATRPGVSMQQVTAEIVNDIANFGPISQEGLKQGVIAAPFGLLGGWASNNAAKLKERRAEAGKAYAESLQEKAAKMSGASPEAAAAYINHVTGDDVVYAQPDALFQIALDKPEIIEALGVTIDEVEQARADGQLVEIPIGEYSVVMSSNPDAAKILNEHITTDVSEETLTEARERASVSRNQKDVSDATTEARQSQVELKSAQKELYDDAVFAGMKPDEAGNLVAMFTANSRIYAAAKGQSHAQWFRENRPVIRKGREMVAGARPRVNPDGSPVFFQEDYRGTHTAPTKKDGDVANPLHDITTVYPEDIYSTKAALYYGHGDRSLDAQSVRIIHSLRHNPNKKLTIYRAVPKGVDAEINPGDWVTINPQYAKMHGDHALNGKYKVIKKSVYARDIYTDGNSVHEWGYDPQPEVTKEEIAAMKSRQRMYQSDNSTDAEAKLKQDEVAFAQAVDDFWNNKLETSNPVPVMTTPLVLKLVGAEVLPVEIDIKVLNKILKDKHGEAIDRDTLKQVPRKIADPIMVLKNRDEDGIIIPGETVVVLDLKDRDKNTIIVPIILDAVSIGSGKVNKIKSVFGKGSKAGGDIQWFATRIALGDLLYVNKKRTTDLLSTARHQSSMALNFSSSFDKSIPNENDLRKLQNQFPTYYQSAAWHGSPHTFDQFTTQRIGSGEGAQAYGWGMYFSSSKKVAEWYRDKLSKKKPAVFLNDNGTPMGYDQKRAAYFTPGHIVPSYGGFDKVIAYHPETDTQGWYVEVRAVVKKEGNWVNDPQWEVTRTHSTEPSDDNIKSVLMQYGFPSTLDNEKGRLYDVTLVPDEADMLDWDKPIFKQSDKVIKALVDAEYNSPDFQKFTKTNPSMGTRERLESDFRSEEQTGAEWYRSIVKEKGTPEAASRYLFSIGIPGITYEGTTSGERNYVVFDDSQVQINQMFQSAKGSIHWEDGKAVISLFKTADASTGIHELLGHYMTQNLLDWGSQDDAPDWMKQDRKTMLEWAGIEDWDGATKEQKVEAHEKWARAAEAYVMEGKAPSLELRDVFRRFADWMRQVYRAMRDMGVEIGPGMRGVFDRMLASEEEIAHASTVSEFMNENADLYVGLTDRQKESLAKQHDQIMERGKEVLLKELIGDINAERKQAMAAERERIEAEVRHEVSNQPFYRMVRELRKPAIRNPVNELTKEWQKKVDDMARYLRDHHGDGVENVKVYDGDIRDEQAKPEAYFRVSHNVKWYQDLYAGLGKTPTLGDYKMLAEDFLRRGFEDLSGYVDPDVEFLEIEQQLEELQKTPQAIPMVQKINTAWLKENYPEELNTFAFMHSNLGQYDLEDLASFYRFSSADEIIWRMKNTPPLSRAIKDAVDARMNEAFPVLTNAEIAEKAEAAMHNEESVALLAVQLDLIREKAGQMRTAEESRKQALQDRELARVSAQKAMEKMPLERAMNLPVWIAAARRAAVKADKAIAEGNWVAAFEQKNIQLHNNAMIQESLNARREFDRVSRYLKRQQGSGKDTWITDEAGPDGTVAKSDRHFAAAGEIMKRYGFGRRDAVEPKEPLSEYVRKMEEENPEMVSIAEWIAVDVKGAPLRSLTLGKLRDIESALRNIKKMARAGKNADGFVTLNGDGLIMTVNNLVDAAEANAKDRQVDMPDKVAPSKMAEFMAGLRKPSKWLLELDGFKDFGAWAKAFYHALADATDFKSFLVNRALQKLEAAYQRAGIDKAQRYRDAHTKIYVPEWETSMSKNWMMAVLLNMGSESNMQRLFSRHPVGISVNTAWNRETVTTVLARELGANYFRLAQDIWDAIDVYDEYAAMVKKVTGATLQKVNPSPISFTMPDGETIHLRGGYYHLKADPRSSRQADLNAAKEVTDTPWMAPYPNTGASKARAASASYAVDLDLTNIHQAIQSQAHDIAFRPVAIDINKLMQSESVKEVFRRKLGDAAYKTFDKWLRVIESGKNAVESQGYMDPAANFFRQRAVVANLLFRVGTVFQNFANPALYGNAVEGFSNKDALMAYMKYGWGEYIPLALSFSAEAEVIRQEVFALSAMMRDKAENPDYTMRDMFDRQDGFMMNSGSAAAREVGARLKIGRDGVVRFGSGMLAFGDQLADIPVWRYAYHKALNEGRSQQEAVRFADSVIENSTGTGRAVDSSMMQMGSPMEKLLTMFMTFVNTQYNRWANEYGIYMKEKDHARLLSFIGVQYLMFGALSAVFSFKGKKDDEELLEWFTKEVLEWPLSMIPIGGSLFKLVIDRSLGFQSYSWAMSPVERNLEQTAKLAVGAWQGKATTEDAMQTAAFLFGYPDQFNDWFWNAYDASVGNMDPELRDLVRRRPKRERR